jgi:transposase InsO family protein
MESVRSKAKSPTQPFHFCASLCLLVAAACGHECGECEPDITYITSQDQLLRKRRFPKKSEFKPNTYSSVFHLNERGRTAKHKKQPFSKQPFNVDSGATVTVIGDANLFESIESVRPSIRVQVANGEHVQPALMGTVKLNMQDITGKPYTVMLQKVLYSPRFASNLLSVDEMWNQHRISTIFRGRRAYFETPDERQITIDRDDRRRYMLHAYSVVQVDADVWHRRFMHYGNETMRKMGCVIPALRKSSFDFSKCDACLQGGGRKLSRYGKSHVFNRSRHRRFTTPPANQYKSFGERISTDLCGPFPKSSDGHRYAIVFHDSATKYIATYPLFSKDKSEVLDAFTQFLSDHRHLLPTGVGVLWSDNGGEFVNKEMDKFCEEICIRRSYTVPYEPSQNPYAERAWGIVLRPMRSSIADSGADERFWPYFMRQATLVHNILCDDECENPYSRVNGSMFNYNLLHAMGCLCYYLLPQRDRKSKLSPRALPAIYLGRDPERNGDFVYVPSIRRLTTAFHLVFNEHRTYDSRLDSNRRVSFSDHPQYFEQEPPVGDTTRHYVEDRDRPRDLREDLDYHPADDEDHGTVSTRHQRGDWNENHCRNSQCTLPRGHPGQCSDDPTRDGRRLRNLPRVDYNPNAHAVCETDGCAFYKDHGGECTDGNGRVIYTEPYTFDEYDQRMHASNPSEDLFQISDGIGKHASLVDPDSIMDPLFGDLMQTTEVFIDDVQHEVLHVDPSLLSDIPCPKQYEDTQKSPIKDTWDESMRDEHQALLENQTWDYVSRKDPRLRGRQPTKSRWVYTIKYNRNGTISRWKSRFVVCGYSQRQGIDYERAFSATLRGTTFRTLLAVAAGKKLRLMQIDVSNAFTQAKMDHVDLFVEPAKGFERWECCKRETGPCICGKFQSFLLHLKRALYGTKQASRLWQSALRSFLVDECSIKFKPSPTDPCLYRAELNGEEIIVGVYVDDLIVAYKGDNLYSSFVKQFMARFKASDPKKLDWFLGMAIDQHEDYSIHLDHKLSIQKIADKFIPNNTVTREYPTLELFSKLDKAQNDLDRAKVAEIPYASIVGALLYVSVTSRPDVAYHTSILAKFLANPSPDCCKAAYHLLQYLHSTKNKRMYFSGKTDDIPDGLDKHASDISKNSGFVAYTDSSWGNKYPYPMFGYGIFLYGGLVSYASKQLKTVAFSSCEAEYAAASYACKEIEFVRNICADMGVILQGRLVLCVDNTAAIDIAQDVGVSGRTKHFDRAIHYLRDLTQLRRILPFYVTTHDQRADGFTKPLDKSSFVKWSSFVVHS